jgi:hypothetical protein
MVVAILSLVGLIVSGAAESLSVQHHGWIMPVLYSSVAGLIIALVALFI